MLKYAYLIDVAIPNSHNLHSTVSDKLQKYTELRKERLGIWRLKTVYIIPRVLSTTGVITNELLESLKLLKLCPGLYILMQKVVILNTCRRVRMFLAEQ